MALVHFSGIIWYYIQGDKYPFIFSSLENYLENCNNTNRFPSAEGALWDFPREKHEVTLSPETKQYLNNLLDKPKK